MRVLQIPSVRADWDGCAWEGWPCDISRARMVLSRDQLLDLTAGRTAGPLDRTIDNQISRLRRKIEPDVLRPRIIRTVRNGGYCLATDVEEEG